jgi:hypothetical protein
LPSWCHERPSPPSSFAEWFRRKLSAIERRFKCSVEHSRA